MPDERSRSRSPLPQSSTPVRPAKTASDVDPETYTKPFMDFITNNPTVFHCISHFGEQLDKNGFTALSEREDWSKRLKAGGKYYTTRNGSSMIAFVVGKGYKPGNGFAMAAGHVDAITVKLKPIPKKKDVEGYVQLGVAPYASGLNKTWWDRDLGIGGRVLVQSSSGKFESKLVKLDWPIAKVPSLAEHFGAPADGPFNKETQMVPIIGLTGSSRKSKSPKFDDLPQDSFISKQPVRLVELICGQLGITDASTILAWELELFDTQPAALIGMDRELLSAPRVDDKICSWAALEGLIYSADEVAGGNTVSMVGFFDDEEIGSTLKQGARGNFMPLIVERVVDVFGGVGENVMGETYANSFLLSADVTHAVNPNFLNVYLENHMPKLNVGLCVAGDSNGHMTTDAVSVAFLTRIAQKTDYVLQIFQIRNDSRSGGTVGPMLSSAMGVRAIDAGIAQLSMHSMRATVGDLDPGLGVKIFAGFFEHYEEIDKEFNEIVG